METVRQRVEWVALGLAALALAILSYALFVRTRLGQTVDAELMTAILGASPGPLGAALAALARPLLFYALAPLVALLGLLALARRRWAAALAAAVVSAVPPPLIFHLREHVLTRPDLGVPGYDYNTFPSTHAGTAFGLLVALLLVWPGPLDRADLTRATFVAALVVAGNVTSYAHRPADVLGSLLIVAAIAWIAVALLGFKPVMPRPRRARRRSSPR